MNDKGPKPGFLRRWALRKAHAGLTGNIDARSDPTADPRQTTAPSEHTLTESALRSLFRRPEFHNLDGLNEYDGDYTHFQPLGDIVTQEMKRAWDLAARDGAPPDNTTKQEGTGTSDATAGGTEDPEPPDGNIA